MSVVCHGYTCWLFLRQCSASLLWQSIVVFSIELQGTSPTTVCHSRSSRSPASAICQTSSTVSFPVQPQHLWNPYIFCRWTISLVFTAWISVRSSCWLEWLPFHMVHQNVGSGFFHFVTKPACDRRTDRQTKLRQLLISSMRCMRRAL